MVKYNPWGHIKYKSYPLTRKGMRHYMSDMEDREEFIQEYSEYLDQQLLFKNTMEELYADQD